MDLFFFVGSVVTVFGMVFAIRVFRLQLFSRLILDRLFSHFHSFISSVDQRRRAYIYIFHVPSFIEVFSQLSLNLSYINMTDFELVRLVTLVHLCCMLFSLNIGPRRA